MTSRIGLSATAAGILFVVASGVMLATMDSMGKHLSGRLGVLQVVWARYAVHTVIVFLWLAVRQRGFGFLRSRRPLAQGVRSFTLLGVTVFLYMSLLFVPLANATAVMFFAPVLVTVLAGIFLHEHVGPHRIVAVIMGFVGVLFIVRPGLAMDWHMLLPLVAAMMLSVYLLITRQVSEHDSRESTIFYSTALGAVALTCLIPWHWTAPGPMEMAMMFAMGVLGALGHVCIVLGFARAPASVLSPFLYTQLLAASVLSITVFGDPLGPVTILGAMLLMGGGLVIWWWESVLSRRRFRAAVDDLADATRATESD